MDHLGLGFGMVWWNVLRKRDEQGGPLGIIAIGNPSFPGQLVGAPAERYFIMACAWLIEGMIYTIEFAVLKGYYLVIFYDYSIVSSGRLHSYILPIPAAADDLHKFTRTASPSILLPTGSFDECR